MTIVELHLDRPAFKRVEAKPGTETTTETEAVVESEADGERSSGGSGIGRKLLLVGLVGAVTFVAMRWMRSSPEEEAAIDIGTEETRPQTE